MILFSYKVTLFFSNLSLEQEQTVDYLQDKSELGLNYTATEVSHLEDVKGVIKFIDYLFYFSLLGITLIVTYYKKKWPEIKKLLFYGGITTVAFLLISLIISIISFDFMFTLFHNIFFPQGNWIFASDSLLIQTFPIDFFVKKSQMIFRISIILGAVMLGLGWKMKKNEKIE
ncbi:MAG: DUF1461 domain-containing protein [Nanoarchaeota archaeon]|nr:DUF1461 domain-containing protein [Nanoarchaeota archaeon]